MARDCLASPSADRVRGSESQHGHVWWLPGRARAPFHTRPLCPALALGPPGYLQRAA